MRVYVALVTASRCAVHRQIDRAAIAIGNVLCETTCKGNAILGLELVWQRELILARDPGIALPFRLFGPVPQFCTCRQL